MDDIRDCRNCRHMVAADQLINGLIAECGYAVPPIPAVYRRTPSIILYPDHVLLNFHARSEAFEECAVFEIDSSWQENLRRHSPRLLRQMGFFDD